jgi:hypothetical protein
MAFCFAQTDAIECAFGDKLILVASCSSRQHRQSVQTGEGCSNMPARGKATPRHAMHTQCQHAATACSMYAVPAVLIGASTRSHAHTLTRPLARRTCVGQPAATACRPWRECIAGNVVGSQLLRQHLRVVVHPSLGSGVERSAVCGMACCGGNIHNLADLALPHSCSSMQQHLCQLDESRAQARNDFTRPNWSRRPDDELHTDCDSLADQNGGHEVRSLQTEAHAMHATKIHTLTLASRASSALAVRGEAAGLSVR